MCRHYDPGRAGACVEDRADPPTAKEGANFCEFFAPPTAPGSAGAAGPSAEAAARARARLEALFGDPDKD